MAPPRGPLRLEQVNDHYPPHLRGSLNDGSPQEGPQMQPIIPASGVIEQQIELEKEMSEIG